MNSSGTDKDSANQADEIIFPWQRGWTALKSIWPQMVYISVGSIAIPQFLLSWFVSQQALIKGQALLGSEPKTLPNILQLLQEFSSQYFGLLLVAGLFGLVGYFGLIALSFQVLYGYRADPVQSLKTGIKTTFPSGILGLFLLLGLGLFSVQVFLMIPALQLLAQFILLIWSVLLAAWPVLLVQSSRNPARTLVSAVKMSYARDTGTTKWSVFFTFLTYHMALISLLSLIEWVELKILHLDLTLNIPRQLWFVTSTWFPFSYAQSLGNLLAWLLISISLGIFAVFTTTYIFDLRKAAIHRVSKIDILV